MQTLGRLEPISLIIAGAYWDTQIYSGELTLFRDDGALVRVQWRRLVDDIAAANPELQTGIRVAFIDGDMFYNESVRKILLDPQISRPIIAQLRSASGKYFDANLDAGSGLLAEHNSPIRFIPSDTETYYQRLFVAGEDGLFSIDRSSQEYVSTKHHDAPTFQVKASTDSTAIAAASGADGLFEFPISTRAHRGLPGKPERVTQLVCTACDWAFQSIVGWSTHSAFLANFVEIRDSKQSRKIREKTGLFNLSEMFALQDEDLPGSNPVVWGSREKVYRLTAASIDVLTYDHKSANKLVGDEVDALTRLTHQSGSEYFDIQGQSEILSGSNTQDVVSVGTAPFGTIIEFDDQLVVVRSDGGTHRYKGEIVHWRVFPRSEHYSNQLHIVFDDRLEIVSFVHDYFVNQHEKLLGFSRSVRGELDDIAF